jgi:hypothetical protein
MSRFHAPAFGVLLRTRLGAHVPLQKPVASYPDPGIVLGYLGGTIGTIGVTGIYLLK